MTQPPSEGGAAIQSPAAPPTARPTHNPRGLACLMCAYDLSGIPADARCPECSAEVAHTRELLLASQPAPTLRSLQLGAFIVIIAVGVQFVFGGVASVAPAMMLVPAAQGGDLAMLVLTALLALFGIAIQAAIALGYWRLTTRLTGDVPREWARPAVRAWLRAITAIILTLTIANMVAGAIVMRSATSQGVFSPGANPPDPIVFAESGWVALMVMSVAASIAEFIRFVLGSLYLGALARRVPDPGTRKLAVAVARISVYIAVGVTGVAILAFAGAIFGSSLFSSSLGAGLFAFGFFGGVLVVGVGGLTLFILWIVAFAKFGASVLQIRKRLAREAQALTHAGVPAA